MIPRRIILPILFFLCLPTTVFCLKKAFISILSSDDFLTPAKVVAFRLRTINPEIPFVILATEDVSNDTIDVLQSRDVNVLQIHKIDTPFLDTHVGAKFQYTKIRLWSLTEFDVLFHIDLDTLPISDLAPVFQCGAFCATFRHSDKFNAGIFVLKPNISVYLDLLEKVSRLDSYDGGDQGFFNAYFDELKYAPMFNDKTPSDQKYTSDIMRISAAYNYDIGMYYLNGGHTLVEPKIIHYTLGPTKPWAWWTYPVFELNQLWNTARIEMEKTYEERNYNKYLLLLGIVVAATMFALREFTIFVSGLVIRKEKITSIECQFLPYVLTFLSVLSAFVITPAFAHPVPSWFFFSFCTVCFKDTKRKDFI
ncbi:unnamed protein product [Auanema sp. JU1783]|nr:unnamed protein product [Auanema sp. JU1783]